MRPALRLMLSTALLAISVSSAPSCDDANPYQVPCQSAADCVLPYVCCHDSVLADIDPTAANACVEQLACPHPDPFLVDGDPCRRGGPARSDIDDPKVLGECAPPLVCCPGTLTCAASGGCPAPKPAIAASHASCAADEDCEATAVCCGIHAFSRQGTCTSVDECGGTSSGAGGAGGGGAGGGGGGIGGAAGSSAGGMIGAGGALGQCDDPGPGGPPAPGSPCEIAAAPGLALYLRLDETDGPACDASGNGNDGAVEGPVMRGSPAKFGLGATLSGGAVHVPSSPTLDPAGGRTIEAWIDVASFNGISSIVTRGLGNSDVHVFLEINGGAGVLAAWSDASSTLAVSSSTGVLQVGSWHHVAVSDDGTTARLYVDARSVGMAQGGLLVPMTSDLYVGSRGSAGLEFSGAVDEVKWWTVARTQAQVCVDAGGTWETSGCSCALP